MPDFAVVAHSVRRKRLREASAAIFPRKSPFVRSARAGEPGANDKVRLGIIGAGEMGLGDLDCFFGNPEVECAVVCDVDDARIAAAKPFCRR